MAKRSSKRAGPGAISARRFGWNPTDTTAAVQSAIDAGGGACEIPYMSGSPWLVRPLTMANKTRIYIPGGGHLKAASSGYGATDKNVLAANLITDIGFLGSGTLEMRRESLSVTADGPHCLNIRGCQRVSVSGLRLINGSGDGLYLGPDTSSGRTPCQDIMVRGLRCTNNRRQGISLTAGRRITIADCILEDTTGTSPQAGIDIEPSDAADPMANIIVRNCLAKNNSGDGFAAPLGNTDASSEAISVLVDQCKVQTGGNNGLSVSNTGLIDEGPEGIIEFRDCVVHGTVGSGIRPIWDTGWQMTVKFTRCTVINSATGLASNRPIRLTLACDTAPAGSGGIIFQDCVIYDNVARNTPVTAVVTGAQTPRVSGTIRVINPLIPTGTNINVASLPDLSISLAT